MLVCTPVHTSCAKNLIQAYAPGNSMKSIRLGNMEMLLFESLVMHMEDGNRKNP